MALLSSRDPEAFFGGAGIRIHGLRELVQAFNKFDKDLVSDLKGEIIEAANPIKLVTQEKVAAMKGIANKEDTSHWSGMRIGADSKSVYIVPAWRSNKGTPQGAVLKGAIMRRMEKSVAEKSDEVEKRLGHFLDTLADDWGSHLAA